MKKILFVAWDSPHVTYLEGLFAPIFEGLARTKEYEFHIMQFSWADSERISFLTDFCLTKGMPYKHVAIQTRPVPALGKYATLFRGASTLKNYILNYEIDAVIARSTMPAKMMLKIRTALPHVKIIFDADGLPIEERIDFALLKDGSFRHRALKAVERKIIQIADAVLTRTEAAASFLQRQYNVSSSKFFIVTNGRDENCFRPFSEEVRASIRSELGIPENAHVSVYSGSLGPQYGVDQMLFIHRHILSSLNNAFFLVLTNNPEFLHSHLTPADRNVIVKKVPFSEVPAYLSIGDVAFAVRKATMSMKGVAPIKLAEYLMVGLPVVASSAIGDTDQLLSGKPFCFILKDYQESNLLSASEWILELSASPSASVGARDFARSVFSLDRSVQTYHTALAKTLQ